MLPLHAFALALLAASSLAHIQTAHARDLAGCNGDPYAGGLTASGDEDGVIGNGGPGAGGDARGILPLPAPAKLCATGLTQAIPPSRTVAAWFGALSRNERQMFSREAAKMGVVGRDGHAFDIDEFDEMTRSFDEAMTRQGMSDGDKLKLLNMMAEDAGIEDGNKANTRDGRGG